VATSVNDRAVRLAKKSLTASDKVLIVGASGWFGQTATAMLEILEIPTFLIGSNAREMEIAGKKRDIQVWNFEKIVEFGPTIAIDCAYLTREMVGSTGLDAYIEVNRQLVQQIVDLKALETLRLVISFSSGAAEIYRSSNKQKSIEIDPYGLLKVEQEVVLQSEFETSYADLVIARVWNTSGSLVTKVNGFALSDLIDQALNGNIKVSSNFMVWRRYCLIEEIIAVALNGSQGSERVFDTGGQLIEIRDLASLIQKLVNPNAKLELPADSDGIPSNYFSDGESWSRWCNTLDFEPASLDEQIEQVAGWMKR
jgi:nucleoside-diphosphate-sugar epimerase